jgi:hypothetical protein
MSHDMGMDMRQSLCGRQKTKEESLRAHKEMWRRGTVQGDIDSMASQAEESRGPFV